MTAELPPLRPLTTEEAAERLAPQGTVQRVARAATTAPAVPTAPAPAVPTAPAPSDLIADDLVRARPQAPPRGWRRALFHASGGYINLGPSRAHLAERELVERARTRVTGCRRIAVMSRKGGVGKTTTTLELGHTLASMRGDRVVALDANPDAGSLAYRLKRETSSTITDLLAARHRIERYADIRGYTSQAGTRLEVVAADDDPRITDALREQDFFNVVELLECHYNLVLMDTGTGVLESAAKGIVQLADQLVVVSGASVDTARGAMSTLDWLAKHGHQRLVSEAVAVINQVRRRSDVDVGRIEASFAERCRAVVRIPWDPVLNTGAEADLDDLRPATRRAYLELAAAVADGFAAPSPARLPGNGAVGV
jgi:putative peptide zinc metalloprotease protein